jgi:hypothetical protein
MIWRGREEKRFLGMSPCLSFILQRFSFIFPFPLVFVSLHFFFLSISFIVPVHNGILHSLFNTPETGGGWGRCHLPLPPNMLVSLASLLTSIHHCFFYICSGFYSCPIHASLHQMTKRCASEHHFTYDGYHFRHLACLPRPCPPLRYQHTSFFFGIKLECAQSPSAFGTTFLSLSSPFFLFSSSISLPLPADDHHEANFAPLSPQKNRLP